MPRVIITAGAAKGLERCRLFFFEKNPHASKRAGNVISKQFTLLENNPALGKPLNDIPELRELIIVFGDSGYVTLYRHDTKSDTLFILAFRHQKEAGY